MDVEINVTRGDIVRFNVAKLFRLKSNLVVLVVSLVIVGAGVWKGAVAGGQDVDWFVVLAVTAVGGGLLFAAIVLFSLVFVLISSTAQNGVVGKHTYTIEEGGLREVTQANDSLNFWPAIRKVDKSRTAISVEIAPWLFHVLPRREFESDQAYEAFFNELRSRAGKQP